MAVADAHPLGARPFRRANCIAKFRTLAEGVVAPAEQDRLIASVERLTSLQPGELAELSFTVDPKLLGEKSAQKSAQKSAHGIFDCNAAAS